MRRPVTHSVSPALYITPLTAAVDAATAATGGTRRRNISRPFAALAALHPDSQSGRAAAGVWGTRVARAGRSGHGEVKFSRQKTPEITQKLRVKSRRRTRMGGGIFNYIKLINVKTRAVNQA